MFFHRQELQFASKPDKPDAVYARKLQEVLGGQYGEITIAMQYMFQGWNMHTPGKYRDLVFGIASEEIGHVEMLATLAALALAESHRTFQLRLALQNRDLIGQAKGILMHAHSLTADAAFLRLAQRSQHTNTKLVEVAARRRDRNPRRLSANSPTGRWERAPQLTVGRPLRGTDAHHALRFTSHYVRPQRARLSLDPPLNARI